MVEKSSFLGVEELLKADLGAWPRFSAEVADSCFVSLLVLEAEANSQFIRMHKNWIDKKENSCLKEKLRTTRVSRTLHNNKQTEFLVPAEHSMGPGDRLEQVTQLPHRLRQEEVEVGVVPLDPGMSQLKTI